MISKRMAPFVIVGLFMGIFVGMTAYNLWQSNQENPSDEDWFLRGALKVGEPAPNFTLTSLDGSQVRFGDIRGKPVILNFWASWCGPCRLEMPAIQARYDEHAPDLVVLAINIGEPADTARSFTEELGLTFPVLLDNDGVVQRDYVVNALPTTFFIDSRGYIKAQHVGLLTESLLDGYLSDIGAELD